MTHILQIDASARPGMRGQVPHGSHTRALTHRFVSQWRALDAQTHAARTARDLQPLQVQYRDVGAQPPAAIGANWVAAVFSPEATPAQRAHLAQSDALIAELRAADVLVLGVPMYNFGVSVQLKSFIDSIARAGITFRYTESGPEGLIKGKRVYVACARGGVYRDTPADSQTPYLRQVLGFLGMTDVEFIYAEGMNLGPESAEKSFAAAEAAIAKLPV